MAVDDEALVRLQDEAECLGPFDFESNEASIEILDLRINKQSCPYVVKRKNICFTVTAINNSNTDVFGIRFSDELEPSLEYVSGTFQIDGELVAPLVVNNIIQCPIDIPAGESVEIQFCVKVLKIEE